MRGKTGGQRPPLQQKKSPAEVRRGFRTSYRTRLEIQARVDDEAAHTVAHQFSAQGGDAAEVGVVDADIRIREIGVIQNVVGIDSNLKRLGLRYSERL